MKDMKELDTEIKMLKKTQFDVLEMKNSELKKIFGKSHQQNHERMKQQNLKIWWESWIS